MPESILEEAQRLIHGDRNKNYGHPRENFADIGALFSGYLGVPVTDIDVANLMILVKVARVKGTGYHRDSFTDIAGYAGCVERIYEEPAEVKKVNPREWSSLGDVPYGVEVISAGGCKWNWRSTVGMWQWNSQVSPLYDKTGPFTEVLS